MLIEGAEVSARQVAGLALRLHRAGQADLAQALGLAVDGNRAVFRFSSDADRARLLRAVETGPGDGLSNLQLALAKG